MGVDEFEDWLRQDYAKAFRTACLVLRNAEDAEDAVQDAFLRVWRFREAIPADAGRNAWLYRVVVNACISSLRAKTSRSGRDDGADALEAWRTGRPSRTCGPSSPSSRRRSRRRWRSCPTTYGSR